MKVYIPMFSVISVNSVRLLANCLFCPHPLRFFNHSFRFAQYCSSENTGAFDFKLLEVKFKILVNVFFLKPSPQISQINANYLLVSFALCSMPFALCPMLYFSLTHGSRLTAHGSRLTPHERKGFSDAKSLL